MAAFLLAAPLYELDASGQEKPPEFAPAGITFASSIPYPKEGTAGLVGLLVDLDDSAQVKDVQVLRDLSPVTDSCLTAVKGWKFAPAEINKKRSPAKLPVEIIFNPRDLVSQSIPLPSSVAESPPQESGQFAPPEVLTGWYAAYPEHSSASGTLVLDVTVNKDGRVSRVSIVRSRVASLTKPAEDSVKKWTFKPGTLAGIPIVSKIVVAFVFRSSPFRSS